MSKRVQEVVREEVQEEVREEVRQEVREMVREGSKWGRAESDQNVIDLCYLYDRIRKLFGRGLGDCPGGVREKIEPGRI